MTPEKPVLMSWASADGTQHHKCRACYCYQTSNKAVGKIEITYSQIFTTVNHEVTKDCYNLIEHASRPELARITQPSGDCHVENAVALITAQVPKSCLTKLQKIQKQAVKFFGMFLMRSMPCVLEYVQP